MPIEQSTQVLPNLPQSVYDYCVGMSADKAGHGEVWLSSQNRNFENKMGPGAIGSIASAVTVAASSFNMVVTDPAPLIDHIDQKRMLGLLQSDLGVQGPLEFVEPVGSHAMPERRTMESQDGEKSAPELNSDVRVKALPMEDTSHKAITGGIQVLGDFIDTDALAPAEAIVGSLSPTEIGESCLYHTHPGFCARVKDGLNVAVAGKAFGRFFPSGSRHFSAWDWCPPNLRILGIVMQDEDFYELAVDGAKIEVQVDECIILIGGKAIPFTLTDLELRLWKQGGLIPAFARWGKRMPEKVTAPSVRSDQPPSLDLLRDTRQLNW